AGVPRWERERVPLLEAAGHIIWVAGLRRGQAAPIRPETRRILEVTLRAGSSGGSPLAGVRRGREDGAPGGGTRMANKKLARIRTIAIPLWLRVMPGPSQSGAPAPRSPAPR